MVLLFAVILFIVSCLMDASAKDYSRSERRKEIRHKELIKKLEETKPVVAEKRKHTVTRRRVFKDEQGRVIAEEIIEEAEI